MKYMITSLMLVSSLSSAETLIWSEEFNYASAPDGNVWSYDLGAGGWGNAELQNYTSSTNNVWVDGSNLVITARRSGDYFSSGRIKTLNKLTFKYGTVEARIQTPDLANGLWPAFWTLGNIYPIAGWPECGEIDIVEMGNKDAITAGAINKRVGSHAHWGSLPNHPNYGSYEDMASPVNDTFVVYRMEWTPTLITTYIDGIKIWEMNINLNIYPLRYAFHEPHFFLLNLAVGGKYTGILNPDNITAPFPAEYKVDWIRIYDNGDTVLGGTSAVIPGENFLVNPGFESGTTNWDLNLSGGSASASSVHARSGSDSLVINSTGAGGWSAPNVSQSFPASQGEVFNLQGYMLNAADTPIAGSSFGLFKIEFRDSGGNVLEPASVDIGTAAPFPYYGAESRPFLTAGSSTDSWIFSETQAEAPVNTSWVSFILLNVNEPGNPGAMYFDDIEAVLPGAPLLPFSLNTTQAGGNMQISFPTQNGVRYQVVYKTSLTNENWFPSKTIIGDGNTNSSSYPTTDPVRYYRVLTP